MIPHLSPWSWEKLRLGIGIIHVGRLLREDSLILRHDPDNAEAASMVRETAAEERPVEGEGSEVGLCENPSFELL